MEHSCKWDRKKHTLGILSGGRILSLGDNVAMCAWI
jgi:acyl-coenzyme A thioesterase PaaI-like protein